MSRDNFIVLAGCLCLMTGLFVFRFQRITLNLARDILQTNDRRHLGLFQCNLTPIWLGTLGWVYTVLQILLSAIIWWFHGFLLAFGYFALGYLAIMILSVLLPFPTNEWSLKTVLAELDGRISRGDQAAYSIKAQVLAHAEKIRQ